MILVFCYIIGIILIIISLLLLSTLRISIKRLEINVIEKEINFDYELYLSLNLFNKIKYLQIKLNKDKIAKMQIQSKIKPEQIEKIKQNASKNKKQLKQLIKKLKIKLSKFNLNINIDTKNVLVTTGIVTLSSIIISNVLSRFVKVNKKNDYKYKIIPSYKNQNILKIDFNCIINVKMVHIIYIIYILLKKRRDGKNERTSNRRSYDYSYE